GAVVAHHDVPLVRPRPTLEDVARRKTGVEKALGDGVGGDGRAADRIGRVDLDQLFVDVVGQLAPTGEHDRRRAGLRLLRLRERREADSRRDGRDDEGGAEGGETHRALREWDGRRCVYVVTRPPWRPVAGLSPATLDARKCQPAPMRLRMSRAPAATPIATPPPNRRAVPVPTSGRSQVTGAAISAAATPTITGTNARCTPSTKRNLFCVNWRACQYPNSVTPTVMAMPSKPPTARMNPNTWSLRSRDCDLEIYTPRARRWFHGVGGRSFHRITSRHESTPCAARHVSHATHESAMFTLRVVRHDRHEHTLAECQAEVAPARGEVIQLDTVDAQGEMTRPSTLWRVVSVTVHVPSLSSSAPDKGGPLAVRVVEVAVLPDIALVPEFAAAAAQILSESKM